MSVMKFKYTDLRGLRIPDEDIQEMLSIIEKSEQEMIDFLGEDRIARKGYLLLFLESFCGQDQWYFKDKFEKKEFPDDFTGFEKVD